MQTSLRAITKKAKKKPKHRFSNLYTMLNEQSLRSSWKELNKRSSPGIDRETAESYSEHLDEHIKEFVERLKKKQYKARLVKRVEIPKDNGKKRQLGIPVLEDKLLQQSVSQIVSAIWEGEFLGCSYGYREGRGAKEASDYLDHSLQFGGYQYVVEADIKGFFDNIDHEWMEKMLELRINDQPFIRLIKKWMKAGILTKEGVIHPEKGSPQGGVISPVLANIYLHYVVDLWFEKRVKPNIEGKAEMVRYADDFVCLFEREQDAKAFYQTLPKRLGKFGLNVSVEKTRIIEFDRGGKGNFDFLGFNYRWVTSLKGKKTIRRTTSKKKLRKSIESFKEWCKEKMSEKVKVIFSILNSKLRGYYNYYGVIGNYKSLEVFYREVVKTLYKKLIRRSQRKNINWEKFNQMIKYYGLLRPKTKKVTGKQLELKFLSITA